VIFYEKQIVMIQIKFYNIEKLLTIWHWKIQLLAWDRHKIYGRIKPVNGIPTSVDNWPSNVNTNKLAI
jgi:hypothetical protein